MCLLGFYDWDLGKNYVIVCTYLDMYCNFFYFLRNRLVSDGDYRSMNRTDDQALISVLVDMKYNNIEIFKKNYV